MVYIDLLIIEDILMNYLIIVSVSIILKRITNFKKIVISSIIGLIPLIFIFIISNSLIIFLLTFIFSILMSVISFDYKCIIYTIKNIIYMYFVSIFLAGSIYLVNTNLLPNIDNYLLNVIILITISPIITIIFIKTINNLKVNYSNYYIIDIYLKDKPIITVTSYLDTGNLLKDPYTFNPIILIDKNLINIKNMKTILVPYNTIDNSNLLKCFRPEKIYIHEIGYTKKVLIGLTDKISIEGCNCILNKEVLERIKI